ncbi:MAG: LysR substrate-binding domain-containing protein [Venatoribacter sp.]
MHAGKLEDFDLNEMAIFAHVVEAGSFTGAAKNLGLPKSTVSRKITQLEERLGVRLIQRTTRSLRLTDIGDSYYKHCSRILKDIDEANIAVTQMQNTPMGTLRIAAPVLFGSTVLASLVAAYMEEHPQVDIELNLSDARIDLIQDGMDVAFRVGKLEDSSLIGRFLGDVRGVLCASPDYIKRHGMPKDPNDLANHSLLTANMAPVWEMKSPEGERISYSVKARLTVNDFASLYILALSGAGIAPLPMLMANAALESGDLVQVLADWPTDSRAIHILYPSNRHLSIKVRSFVDFVIERLRPEPS